MTEFVKKEFEELDKFQERISKYGLEVNRSCIGGHYVGQGTVKFCLSMYTKPNPVKGNKKLMDRLREDGFYVETHRAYNGRHMVFYVTDFVNIQVR